MIKELGQHTFGFFQEWGKITNMFLTLILRGFKAKGVARRTIEQMYYLGIKSIPVSSLTALFVGMAFTIQLIRELLRFGAATLIGGIVGIAVFRELGPLLTGVVFAGRVGAAISAEIGTMKVTEQVEALESMSQHPLDFLVLPRVLACSIMLPLIVGLADVIGFFSGYLTAVGSGKVNPYAYINSAQKLLTMTDIVGGLSKAVVFGFVIALVSCYTGLQTTAGAKGVGTNTTKAVVISLVAIFILNYFLSLAIFA